MRVAVAAAALLVKTAALSMAARGLPLQPSSKVVILGGGSTGSVVAGRLGSAGYSVLVLEAGGPTQRSLGEHVARFLRPFLFLRPPRGLLLLRRPALRGKSSAVRSSLRYLESPRRARSRIVRGPSWLSRRR